MHARFVGLWRSESAREEFLNRAKALGVADRIEITGAVTARSKVRDLLLTSDAFLLPTYYPVEAMPLSILEAMNAGTPVITTRAGGIPEVIEDDVSGLFVSPKSPDEIAAAIVRLREPDTWRRLSMGARTQFLRHFHPDAVRSRWEELLAELTKR